jgi:hypothetical protein
MQVIKIDNCHAGNLQHFFFSLSVSTRTAHQNQWETKNINAGPIFVIPNSEKVIPLYDNMNTALNYIIWRK